MIVPKRKSHELVCAPYVYWKMVAYQIVTRELQHLSNFLGGRKTLILIAMKTIHLHLFMFPYILKNSQKLPLGILIK